MWTIVIVVGFALVFDYINGFHDAANSIATIVSTRVLSPRQAVIWAAFFNFIAFLIFDTGVADSIAHGIHADAVTLAVIAAALFGAILWDLFTWVLGLPTSSSHALLGGFGGAAIMHAGFGALVTGFFLKTAAFIVISPLIGMMLGYGIMKVLMWTLGNYPQRRVDRWFRKLQLLSAGLYSLGHGGNDAQKTMGLIVAALLATGHLSPGPGGKHPGVPLWVVLSCHAAMGLGTLSGGMRIVKTMGMKITKLAPVGGFAAETAGAASLFFATAMNTPVSTTHTITGAIVGVGTTRKFSAVRWGVAGRIVWAWIFTVPGAGIAAALAYLVFRLFGWQ